MLAAAITPRLSRRFGSARIIWLSLAVTEPLNLISPLAQPGWSSILVVLGAAVGGAGQIVYDITNNSLRQQLCPDYLLSRITATMRFLIMGSFPLGALLGGTLGELIGLRGTLWISGPSSPWPPSPSTSHSATPETPPTYPTGHRQPLTSRAIVPGRPSGTDTESFWRVNHDQHSSRKSIADRAVGTALK